MVEPVGQAKPGWRGEFVEGINSVAAAGRDPSGRVIAAIDVWGPDFRFPGDADPDELGRMASDAADAVAAALR